MNEFKLFITSKDTLIAIFLLVLLALLSIVPIIMSRSTNIGMTISIILYGVMSALVVIISFIAIETHLIRMHVSKPDIKNTLYRTNEVAKKGFITVSLEYIQVYSLFGIDIWDKWVRIISHKYPDTDVIGIETFKSAINEYKEKYPCAYRSPLYMGPTKYEKYVHKIDIVE